MSAINPRLVSERQCKMRKFDRYSNRSPEEQSEVISTFVAHTFLFLTGSYFTKAIK